MKMSLFFLVVEHVLVVEPVETPFRFDRLSDQISSGEGRLLRHSLMGIRLFPRNDGSLLGFGGSEAGRYT